MHLASLDESSVRDGIRERFSGFHPGSLRRWGTLSPGGVMCHLAVCYEIVVDGGACSERSGPLQRTVMKYGALRVPVRWPRGYPTLPELVEGAPGVRPGDFFEDQRRLLKAFDRFVASSTLSGRTHPVFGALTHWEWMRWGYLHADHHLRQFGL